jgi:hypothetical protein
VKVVFGKPIFVKKGDEEKKITQQAMATLKKMLPADHT